MALRIPSELFSGFKIVTTLSKDDVNELSLVIAQTRIGAGFKEFESFLSTTFNIPYISELAPTLYSFGSILLKIDDSIDNIATMLNESFSENSDDDYDHQDFIDKLTTLLNHSYNLRSTYKALDLILDNDIIYRKSRIFSDIRLLFDDNVVENKTKREGVIIHRVKLECEINGERENYFIALDLNDVVKLKESLNRAIAKDEQIRNDYSNIHFIEITD